MCESSGSNPDSYPPTQGRLVELPVRTGHSPATTENPTADRTTAIDRTATDRTATDRSEAHRTEHLHLLVEGTGPPVLLSGGLGMAWFEWDEVAARLRGACTVIRFDRPGLGLSPRSEQPTGRDLPTAEGEAHRMAAVLDFATGPRTAAVLVAHSLAGFHAEAFARLFPERTTGLVLVDSSAEPDPSPRPLPELRIQTAAVLGAVLHRTGLIRALGPVLHRTSGEDAATPHFRELSYGSGRYVRTALLENTLYQDIAAELALFRRLKPFPAIPLEVLAALGDVRTERGRRQWLERQRELAALSPLGRLQVLDDSGHLVMRDRPDAVVDAVRRCLGGPGGPGEPPTANRSA